MSSPGDRRARISYAPERFAQLDVNGAEAKPQRERIWAFADEAKPDKNCPWLYLGAVLLREPDIVPVVEDIVTARGGYLGEVHFRKISRDEKERAATALIELALADRRVHFASLAVNVNLLSSSSFGASGPALSRRIHTRFFRTLIAGGLARSFGEAGNLVGIVHDHAHDLAQDESFLTGTAMRLERKHGLVMMRPRILLEDSDHRRARNVRCAHLLQLADLLLGATRQCMEATSTKARIVRVGRAWLPVIERVTSSKDRDNPNSRYGHRNRIGVSFFPRRSLSPEELSDPWTRATSAIYWNRSPKLTHSDQVSLF